MRRVLMLASFLGVAALATRGPRCSNVSLPVSIKAKNLALPATLSAANLQGFINAVFDDTLDLTTNLIDVEGIYTLNARYCEPEVYVASRTDTLQFLVHGITQTLDYWSGLAPPGLAIGGDTNSWIAYASRQGYPTLSMDRLGNGLSSHPDGIAVVQIPAQVETIHSLVTSIRNGTAVGNRAFKKVVYVGHSFGSELGNAHAANYPDEVDAYILTGYTPFISDGLLPLIALGVGVPAAVELPDRFGTLPPSYIVPINEDGTDHLFVNVDYIDPQLLKRSWTTRGTVALGELVSTVFSPSVVQTYKGDIFVLTGSDDAIFCAEGLQGLETAVTEIGDCGEGSQSKVAQVQTQYPNAKSFDYLQPKNTGHSTVLQYGAQAQFKYIHDWLAERNY